MYDICTIGHITLDKVVTTKSVKHMPGGTSFYFSKAIQQFDINYVLVTALAQSEIGVVNNLSADGITVHTLPSEHSVYFENIYSENQDYREQNVLQKAAPFGVSVMPSVDAKIYHLGPLLSDDISVDLIRFLSLKGMVSLDVQGLLRSVENKKVIYHDWVDKKEALPYVSILKANEHEMEVVTGWSDVQQGARYLADLGVQEVIITLGSRGSLIFKDGVFHEIPAYKPSAIVDATGCGDTYMAGYLTRKIKGGSIQESGEYGAAMATLKIGSSGPFFGNSETVQEVLTNGVAERHNVLQFGL